MAERSFLKGQNYRAGEVSGCQEPQRVTMQWGHAGVFLCQWNGFCVGLWWGLLKAPHDYSSHTVHTQAGTHPKTAKM